MSADEENFTAFDADKAAIPREIPAFVCAPAGMTDSSLYQKLSPKYFSHIKCRFDDSNLIKF